MSVQKRSLKSTLRKRNRGSQWVECNIIYKYFTSRTINNIYVLHITKSDGDLSSDLFKFILINGSETLVSVLGLTSIVSVLCHLIGKAFQWFLLIEDNSEDKSIGTVSAILFYILALQTGLTTLESEKRFIRLSRNFCLLVTALFHFLHNLVGENFHYHWCRDQIWYLDKVWSNKQKGFYGLFYDLWLSQSQIKPQTFHTFANVCN